jgi:hypothetical protein
MSHIKKRLTEYKQKSLNSKIHSNKFKSIKNSLLPFAKTYTKTDSERIFSRIASRAKQRKTKINKRLRRPRIVFGKIHLIQSEKGE